MKQEIIQLGSRLGSLNWLTGPVFDKELRVSSRRKRNYFLRTAYLVLMTIFIGIAWASSVFAPGSGSGSLAYQISRTAEAGKAIITFTIWFQFIATQLIALVILNNALGEEINKRSLAILLTTPITSLQIVFGKLLSKLLQMILLLALSLPLLTIVRVFGGVPWDFLISSLCVTLTAILFTGSVSLFSSIIIRQSLSAIGCVIALFTLLYGGIPLALQLLHVSSTTIQSFVMLTNPLAVMHFLAEPIVAGVGAPPFFSWPQHCLVMLAATIIFLTASVALIRKFSLNLAFNPKNNFSFRQLFKPKTIPTSSPPSTPTAAPGPLRTVKGSPLIWKELSKPFMGRRISNKTATIILFALLITTYLICSIFDSLVNQIVHIIIMYAFLFMGYLRTASLSASSIVSEKQARTWTSILMTPIDDWQIIKSKALAVFYRNLPIWIILTIHILLFGLIHNEAQQRLLITLIFIPVGMIGSLFFIISSGLYFSARLKTVTAAVASTIGANLFLQYSCCTGSSIGLSMMMFNMNQPGSDIMMIVSMLIGALINIGINVGIGFLFLWRAKVQLRKNLI